MYWTGNLNVPQQLEWVHEVTPSLEPGRGSGLQVQRCPLLVLGELSPRRPRVGTPDAGSRDCREPQVRAAITLGFDHEGTEQGVVAATERGPLRAANDTSLSAAGSGACHGGCKPSSPGRSTTPGATSGRSRFASRRCHRDHRSRRAARRRATRHRGGGHRGACHRCPAPAGLGHPSAPRSPMTWPGSTLVSGPAGRHGLRRRAQPCVSLDRAHPVDRAPCGP